MLSKFSKKTKIFAALLAILIITQGINIFAGQADESPNLEALNAGTLGESEADVQASGLALGASTLGATRAVGDIKVSLVDIASLEKLPDANNDGVADGYRYQTFTKKDGGTGGNLTTTVFVTTHNVINGGKIVLKFDNKTGSYIDSSDVTQTKEYFEYVGVNYDSGSIFESVGVNGDGDIEAVIKAGTASGLSASFDVTYSFDITNFDGGIPPNKLIASIQAKAHAGGIEVSSTPVREIRSFEKGLEKTLVTPYFPTVQGTLENPVHVYPVDQVSLALYSPMLHGYYRQNKYADTFENRIYYPMDIVSTPTGYKLIAEPDGVTPKPIVIAEGDPSGVPAGTYKVYERILKKDALDTSTTSAGEQWSTRNEDAQNIVDSKIIYYSIPSTAVDGSVYSVYFSCKYRYLGSDESEYSKVVSQHVVVDSSSRANVETNFRHRVDQSFGTSGSAFMVHGETISRKWNVTMQRYSDAWSQRNSGDAHALGVRQSIFLDRQEGTGEKWANFSNVKVRLGRATLTTPWPKGFKYNYTIENTLNGSTRETELSSLVTIDPLQAGVDFDTAAIPDYDGLGDNEVVQAVHITPVDDVPDGLGGKVQTDGAWAPKTAFGITYAFKAWKGDKWPNGETITPGFYLTPTKFSVEYNDPITNKPTKFVGNRAAIYNEDTPVEAGANYQFLGPEVYMSAANIDVNAQNINPGDTVSYRILAKNNPLAASNWINPALIIRLPEGMTLEDQSSIVMKKPDGTKLGNMAVASSGTVGGFNYYRLTNSDNLSFPASSSNAFYVDIKVNAPVGIVADTYYPEILATSGDANSFYSAGLSYDKLPNGQTIADYGLADTEHFSYYKMNVGLTVAGKIDAESNSYINSSTTQNFPEGWSPNTAVGADPGETVGVRLSIKNKGSVRLGSFKLYDVVPRKNYEGSSSTVDVDFAGITSQMPAGSKIYYFVGSSDPRSVDRVQDVINDIAGGSGEWTTTPGSQKVKAFLVDLGTATILPGQTFDLDFGLKLSGEVAAQTAYNRFSFTTAPTDSLGNLIGATATFKSLPQCFSNDVYQITYEKTAEFAEITQDWPLDQTGLFGVGGADELDVTTDQPKRPGYTFGGWFDNPEGTGSNKAGTTKSFTQNTSVESDKWYKVYAKWSVDSSQTVNVNFNFNGGKAGALTSYTESTYVEQKLAKASVANQPTKGGYKFVDWYKNPAFDEDSKWIENAQISSADIASGGFTLHAKWEIDPTKKATFKFDLDKTTHPEVTGTAPDQAKGIGEKITEPTGIELPGYTLIGWKNTSNNSWWNFDTEITGSHFDSSPITIKAVWEVADGTNTTGPNGPTVKPDYKINVVFVHNNETTNTTKISGRHAKDNVTAPAVTYPGYKLVSGNEWTDQVTNAKWAGTVLSSHYAAAKTDEQGDKYFEVLANWAKDNTQTINVNFNFNGGKAGALTSYTESTYVEQKLAKASVANQPIKGGYIFAGWYKDPTFTEASKWAENTQVSSADIATSGFTLYAKWDVDPTKKATFKFDLDKTTHPEVTGTALDQSKAIGETVAEPTSIELPGYALIGWKNASDGSWWNFSTTITNLHFDASPITLKAVWEVADGTNTTGPNGPTTKPDYKINVVFVHNNETTNTTKATGKHVNNTVAAPVVTYPGYKLVSGNEWTDQVTNAKWAGTVLSSHYAAAKTDEQGDKYFEVLANWVKDNTQTINVNFDFNGGKAGALTTYTENTYIDKELVKASVANQPTKGGYIFAGWYKDPTFVESSKWLTSTKVSSSDIASGGFTLYAKWDVDPTKKATFKFDLDKTAHPEVTGTAPDQAKGIGETVAEPTDVELSGYTLIGWKNTNDNTWWNFSTTITNLHFDASPITLKAVWEVADGANTTGPNGPITKPDVKIDVVFDFKGGNIGAATSKTETGKHVNETVTIPVGVTKKGHTIVAGKEWIDQVTNKTWTVTSRLTPEHMKNGGATINANWKANTYKIKFLNTGATVPGSLSIKSIDFGTAVPTLPDSSTTGAPSKTGYEIAGWKDKTTGQELLAGTIYSVDDDTELEPIWTAKKYFVNLNNNYGTTTTINKQPVDFDETITLQNAVTRKGYEFKGWAESATGPVIYQPGDNYTHTIETDKNLFAKWDAKSYTVTFDKNGGTTEASPTSMNINYDATIAGLPGVSGGTAPTKKGYDFKGWATSGTAVSANFIEGESFEFDSNITVYAVWEIKTYTITVQQQTYNYNQTLADAKDYGNAKTFKVKYGDSFKANVPLIDGYEYKALESTNSNIAKVENDENVFLIYKEYTYTLSLSIDASKAVELNVNDKYPVPKVNKPTLDEFVEIIGLKPVVPTTKTLKAAMVGNPKITSPQYDALDFNVVDNTGKPVDVIATWPSGQTVSATVNVKVLDKKAPVVVTPANQHFKIDLGILTVPQSKSIKLTEAEILENAKINGLTVIDNYDGPVSTTITYREGNYSSIKWELYNEYALIINGKDSNGNTIPQTIISFYLDGSVLIDDGDNGNHESGGTGGGNKPDKPSTLPGDNSGNNGGNIDGAGNNGSNSGGTINNGSGNNNGGSSNDKIPQTGGGNSNSPGGNSFDNNGNLVDSNGNVIVDKNDLPKGSTINSAGQLIDSKGNLINLNGLAGGQLPSTGIVAGGTSIGLVSIASLIILLKNKKKKQDENQL